MRLVTRTLVMAMLVMLDVHAVGLFCGFVGGLLLSYEAFSYLRTNTYTLAVQEQRVDRGYMVWAPPEDEIKREIRELYVPRVRRRKYVDAIGFSLIAAGFFLELVNLLLWY